MPNDLPSVLLKFRQKAVGIGADIKAMFSRIRLTRKDARYHRFLWKGEGDVEVCIYQVNHLTFGDGPSPFIAIKTLLKTASDFGDRRERAVSAIKNHFYVDDYLDSFDTAEEAIEVGNQGRATLKDGDFNITKWASNSPTVRSAIGSENPPEFNQAGNDTEAKVLGMK